MPQPIFRIGGSRGFLLRLRVVVRFGWRWHFSPLYLLGDFLDILWRFFSLAVGTRSCSRLLAILGLSEVVSLAHSAAM